jgi:hypothetical protein
MTQVCFARMDLDAALTYRLVIWAPARQAITSNACESEPGSGTDAITQVVPPNESWEG